MFRFKSNSVLPIPANDLCNETGIPNVIYIFYAVHTLKHKKKLIVKEVHNNNSPPLRGVHLEFEGKRGYH